MDYMGQTKPAGGGEDERPVQSDAVTGKYGFSGFSGGLTYNKSVVSVLFSQT